MREAGKSSYTTRTKREQRVGMFSKANELANGMTAASATLLRENGPPKNRRGSPRKALNWVVLVYFDKNNWGRLLDINESGMCIEFAEPPLPGRRIRFTLETMGRIPAIPGGEVSGKKFQAGGEIKWTREFERTAGVRFTELAEESRKQIRQWLLCESPNGDAAWGNETKGMAEAPVPQPELPEAVEVWAVSSSKVAEYGPWLEVEKFESSFETAETLEPRQFEEILDAATFQAYGKVVSEEKRDREPTSGAKGWKERGRRLAVPASLVILGAIAGLKLVLPSGTHPPGAAARIRSGEAAQSEPVHAEYRSNARDANPFFVEVQDAENRRWLLWFDHNSAQTVSVRAIPQPTLASSSAVPEETGGPARQTASAKSGRAHRFALVRPKVERPKVEGLPEVSIFNAPAVASKTGQPPDNALGGILTKVVKPDPATGTLRVASEVQQARVVSSVPPVYPALAKVNRISGDVTLDALVDASGKVADVRVVGGPNLLREAAINALRLWKYEPARSAGQPVSSHLSVTMKFHFE